MSRQKHFSTMAAAVVPRPPWCHPACTEHATTNQDHRPSFLSGEAWQVALGCRYGSQRTPWWGSCCKEGIPKRFCNDDTMMWIFLRCKTETQKFMCGRLPGKRIVCSASKVTTCSSVYQTCQVVVNSMLHQQGDNTVIMYQSCHATATVKQDDSHYK